MKWLLRIALALVALLVICVGVLIAMKMRKDADRMQNSITIHASPEAIWPYLYEPDKLKAWVTWLKDVERPAGDPAVGSKSVWVMEDANNGGQIMKIQSTVTAVDPHRRLQVALLVPGAFHGTAEYTLTDAGGGATVLSADAHYSFDVWFANLLSPVVFASASKKMQSDEERLRAAVENTRAAK